VVAVPGKFAGSYDLRLHDVSGDRAIHPLRRRQIRQRRTEEYADACGSTLRRAPVGTDLVRYCPDIHACGVVGLLGHRQRQEIVGEVVGNNLEQKLGR